MKKNIQISWDECSNANELQNDDRELILQSKEAALHAYAPYSGFGVGCVLRLGNGKTVLGNNQENIAYPSGLCAERVALFSAGANFPDTPITTVAITIANHSIATLVTPCGSCRQVLAESEQRQKLPIRILLEQPDGRILIFDSAAQLLPLAFEALLATDRA